MSSSGFAEAEAVAADRLVQALEVDMCTAERHDKEQATFLVLEKQVLGVPSRQLALQSGAFRHREHGRVRDRLGVDAELGQAGEQVLAGSGHAAGGSELRIVMPSYPNRCRAQPAAAFRFNHVPQRGGARACQPAAFAA
jgi:hypothetical protein